MIKAYLIKYLDLLEYTSLNETIKLILEINENKKLNLF